MTTTQSTSVKVFTEVQGEYRTVGELAGKLTDACERYVREIPIGYDVGRLIDAGQSDGWIRRRPEDQMIVVAPPSSGDGSQTPP